MKIICAYSIPQNAFHKAIRLREMNISYSSTPGDTRIMNVVTYYRPHPKDGEGNSFTLLVCPRGGSGPAGGGEGVSKDRTT